MCEYEIQQLYIKDIEWIKKTKQMVIEREERYARIQAERKERAEKKKQLQEEAAARKEEERKKQEEIKKQREQEKKEREEAFLKQLEKNPFEEQIDLAENLIYFTSKQANLRNEAENSETPKEDKDLDRAAAKMKQIEDAVKLGKIEVSMTKAEKLAMSSAGNEQKVKKGNRKRDGQSMFSFEEGINLDHPTIMRFGSLDVSPPADTSDAEKAVKTLASVRDALKLAGQIE